MDYVFYDNVCLVFFHFFVIDLKACLIFYFFLVVFKGILVKVFIRVFIRILIRFLLTFLLRFLFKFLLRFYKRMILIEIGIFLVYQHRFLFNLYFVFFFLINCFIAFFFLWFLKTLSRAKVHLKTSVISWRDKTTDSRNNTHVLIVKHGSTI